MALALLLVSAASLHAQNASIVVGALDAVRNQSQLNIRFNYDSMRIGEDGLSDLQYQERREHDLDMREPNAGVAWRASWNAARKSSYEPAFLRAFHSLKPKVMLGEFPDARYTMLVHTPGWNRAGRQS